jgi:hypothetical protein
LLRHCHQAGHHLLHLLQFNVGQKLCRTFLLLCCLRLRLLRRLRLSLRLSLSLRLLRRLRLRHRRFLLCLERARLCLDLCLHSWRAPRSSRARVAE